MIDDKKQKLDIRNIGKNIKHFRRLAGLKSQEVAEMACISHAYYKRIESNNKTSPSLDTLIRIAIAVNVPIEFILKDSGYRLFADYKNVKMVQEISELNDEESEIYSNTIELCYAHMKKKKIDKDKEID